MLKYWLTVSGWKINSWFHRLGLDRFPLVDAIWFTSKRLVAGWLSSGRGVPLLLGGELTYVHPFSIIYSDSAPYEPYTQHLFQEAIKPGATVLDLGAHHGYFSLVAARLVGKAGRVYSFEPAAENFKILKKNVELNHLTNVIVVNKAVSNTATAASFFLCKPNDISGSLFPTLRPDEYSVPVVSTDIDSFLAGQPVDVVKMDIEGAEPYALEGMKKTLSRSKDVVLIVEINSRCLHAAGVEVEDFLAQLDKAGFECQLIDEDRGCLQPANTVLEEAFRRGHYNLFCLKR